MDLGPDPPPAEQSGDQVLEAENLRPKVVWEVAAEAARLLRCHCRPQGGRGHRLSRAVAPHSILHQLSWGRSGQREELCDGLEQEPPGEVQPLQVVLPLWAVGPMLGEEKG